MNSWTRYSKAGTESKGEQFHIETKGNQQEEMIRSVDGKFFSYPYLTKGKVIIPSPKKRKKK